MFISIDFSIVADSETSLEDQYHTCFALGKALEDQGDYERSFKYYEKGNSLKKTESRYDSEKMTIELKLQKEVCQVGEGLRGGLGFPYEFLIGGECILPTGAVNVLHSHDPCGSFNQACQAKVLPIFGCLSCLH